MRRPGGKQLKQVHNIGTVKRRVGKSLMVWERFSGFSGLGPLYHIEGIIDKYIYSSILENQMLPVVAKICVYGGRFTRTTIQNIYQNSLNHGLVQTNHCNAMACVILFRIYGYNLMKTTWSQIQRVQIDKLIESMSHRCTKFIKNNGCHQLLI